ncbi:hypothetical protein A0J48_014475 [Sphaerospermopsis aphanizomenoides BCCUSP55]|uniref:hypothetical protein n=1 Tax=Sphaerospermopsis aphanizomenoides TaxID=459663 RepID=UPI0019066C35|nr:hypothetical protein [Sphaerospermopsis aphanizomenoides]MBK1988728.1 hypothetical protein [Sphaerospermopsis aphanizomenoides BCCUSP55]
MDNHNVKPEPQEVTKTSPEESKNISSSISSSQNLLVKHPWLWFVGLLGIPLLVTIFGYYQLIYVGYTPQIEPEKPAKVVREKINTTPSNLNNPTPLWLMLAIALTCASGCWVIYRLLKLPQRV